jgi:hypothetical protein
LEALAIALYRQAHGRSPTVEFGRMPPGYRASSSYNRRHQPDQTPGKAFLERLAVEVLFLGMMESHHPAVMIDGPGARAAPRGDGREEGILQVTPVGGGIYPGLGDSAAGSGASAA